MAGKISALELQKHTKDRVNVYLDGEFAFGLAVFVAAKLKTGMWLSDEAIAELKAADGVEQAHNRALNYLSYRPRSESEVRDYLRDKAYPANVVEDVLARLRRVDLVDDVAFARYWCDNRAQFRPRGKRMLRHELRQKGVGTAAIDAALETYDERAAIEQVARDQGRRLTHLSPDTFHRRLTGRLARRGFSYDLIRETLATLDFPDLNHEQSEED